MEVEFQNQRLTAPVTEDILVKGEKIGEMEPWRGGFHTRIHLPGYINLIQGYGKTKEEAILNAIRGGRHNGVKLLSEINALEKMFLGLDKEEWYAS